MDTILQDVRYGIRQLARNRALTAAAVLCIAIGVGANTTIFSVVNAVLLRPIPGVSDSAGLLEMGRAQAGENPMDTLSYPTWRDLIDGARDEVDIALWNPVAVSLSGVGETAVELGFVVTPSYFSVLGVQPAAGRFFTEDETPVAAAEPLIVISHGLWQRRYGSDGGVVGREVRLNGEPATIVGVAPRGFGGHLSVLNAGVWVPLGMRAPGLPTQEDLGGRNNSFLLGIGRLRPGVSIAAARAAGEAVMAGVVAEFPRLEGMNVGMTPLGSLPSFVQSLVSVFLAAMMVVVGLVLMIACINVAGMLLARGAARRKEIAVRQALGAGRNRLVRQLLTESLLLFVCGGVLGLLLSAWTTSLLAALRPPTPPPFVFSFDLAIDRAVLAFTSLLTLATGVLFGLGPALRSTRPDLVAALKDDRGAGHRRSRLRGALVTGQVAITVLLLIASGLFLRALISARNIDTGFDPNGVVTMSLDLELHGYNAESGLRFYQELGRRLEQTPGIEAASVAALLPLGLPSSIGFGGVNVEGVEPPPNDISWDADLNVVSPGYFDTLRIPLLRGRDFDDRDVAGAPRVAIINAKMAEHFWPDGDALGREFIMGGLADGTRWQVIGIARDSRYESFTGETPFFTYLPLAQSYRPQMSLQVRGRNREAPSLAAIRGVLRELDPDLPLMEVTGLREYVEIGFLPQRVAGSVAGILGIVGLLLGAVGIYGVTAYAVNQRLHEIGIRKALGAPRRQVMRLVVRQGMLAPLLGMALGVGLALPLTRLLAAFLMGISPLDPITFIGVVALLAAVAFLANWLPARRAANVDPLVSLRHE
jgi:predicted permease